MIPLLRPSCTQAEIDAVADVLRSGWWGNGPVVQQFEAELAERTGYRYAVTTNSATAALHLALLVSGVGPGDEVIVPALTFISTALAVTYTGAKPVFADINPDTLCIDWLDPALSKYGDLSIVISVDYAGYSAGLWQNNYPNWLKMISPIQDAAHSMGGITYGGLVCYSFHPVKNLATGDGGAILTNDKAQADRLRALRWCGIDRSTWERTAKRYGWDYDISGVGYKCHWNDIQAAIGLQQLKRLDDMNARRRQIAEAYTANLRDFVQTPPDHPAHTWHLYPIRVDADRRNALIDYLLADGISAGVHYKPLTYYPIYSDQQTPPVTEREWRRLVSLPIFPDMTDGEVGQVIDRVKSFFKGEKHGIQSSGRLRARRQDAARGEAV